MKTILEVINKTNEVASELKQFADENPELVKYNIDDPMIVGHFKLKPNCKTTCKLLTQAGNYCILEVLVKLNKILPNE